MIARAAWTVPVVMAAAAAPAQAASICGGGTCPDISFGTIPTNGTLGPTTTNWTASGPAVGPGGADYGFYNSSQGKWGGVFPGNGTYFAMGREFQSTANTTFTLTQTGQTPLVARCTYTLKFGVGRWVASNAENFSIQAQVAGTTVATYSYPTTENVGDYDNKGIQTYSISPTVGGNLQFQIVWTHATTAYDDVFLYAPSLTCT